MHPATAFPPSTDPPATDANSSRRGPDSLLHATASDTSATALSAVGLVKKVGTGPSTRRILDGVDLDVSSGSFLAVMGPSGSGKSTLLNLLAGLDTPTAGAVLLEGTNLASITERARTELRRRRIGLVFQAFNLLPVLSAQDNVALPLIIDRRDREEVTARVNMLLELVGLWDRRTQRPSELSGGEQQRVAIARALAASPAIVLADEPTGALDSHTGAEILTLFSTLRAELGSTIVMVTHDPTCASAADEVVEMRDGQVLARSPDSGP